MIGNCITKVCEENNLTIKALAEKSGIPPTTIYSIISGKSKNPGINTLFKICRPLNVSLCDMLKEYQDGLLLDSDPVVAMDFTSLEDLSLDE